MQIHQWESCLFLLFACCVTHTHTAQHHTLQGQNNNDFFVWTLYAMTSMGIFAWTASSLLSCGIAWYSLVDVYMVSSIAVAAIAIVSWPDWWRIRNGCFGGNAPAVVLQIVFVCVVVILLFFCWVVLWNYFENYQRFCIFRFCFSGIKSSTIQDIDWLRRVYITTHVVHSLSSINCHLPHNLKHRPIAHSAWPPLLHAVHVPRYIPLSRGVCWLFTVQSVTIAPFLDHIAPIYALYITNRRAYQCVTQ